MDSLPHVHPLVLLGQRNWTKESNVSPSADTLPKVSERHAAPLPQFLKPDFVEKIPPETPPLNVRFHPLFQHLERSPWEASGQCGDDPPGMASLSPHVLSAWGHPLSLVSYGSVINTWEGTVKASFLFPRWTEI